MKKYLLLLSAFFLITIDLSALPQFALLSGNRCINCHVSYSGAAARGELGFYARKEVGLLKPENVGLGWFHEQFGQSNSVIDSLLFFGFDVRYQSAEIAGTRKNFFMQATPYLTVTPLDWLTLYGQYNFAKNQNLTYIGQEFWSAYALIMPSIKYPMLKLGFFQPLIGTRFDDHTMLIRQDNELIGIPIPVIPPDYAEYGAELNYEAQKWLSLTFGVFSGRNMSDITLLNYTTNQPEPLVDKNSVSITGRVAYWKRFMDDKLNTCFGAGTLINGNFSIIDLFLHFGLTDKASLLTEYCIIDKKDFKKLNNISVDLTYQLLDALLLDVRVEHGITKDFGATDSKNINQFVFGTQIFPLPFIELRPEYRIYDGGTTLSKVNQFAIQVHLFY